MNVLCGFDRWHRLFTRLDASIGVSLTISVIVSVVVAICLAAHYVASLLLWFIDKGIK